MDISGPFPTDAPATSRPFSDHTAILHGGDYNPGQWLHAPEVIEQDFALMRRSGCNTFTLGVFAWTALEPEEGRYTFAWLDHIFERMREAGHGVILATPSGGKPAWLAETYPEVRRIDEQGNREPYRLRHNHCWSSEVFRARIRALNTRLAQRYADHPALRMWHVSNEMSGACYCENCLGRWQRWLKDRYRSLDALNRAWWTAFWSHTYTRWSQIDPRDEAVDGLRLDWRRFQTWQIAEHFRWEAEPLRRTNPAVPVTTNFMGLYPEVDYGRLSEVVDLVADDQYPFFDAEAEDLLERVVRVSFKDDLYRNFRSDRPWMLMECAPDWVQWSSSYRLKRPGIHRAEMLQALGHGAEGTLYFQWRKGRGAFEKLHSAVVDHVGHGDTRVFREIEATSRTYTKLQPLLGSRPEASVALLVDWECGWAMEATCGIPDDTAAYLETCLRYYAALWRRGVTIDCLRPDRAELSAYRCVVAPALFLLHPGVASKIADFVRGGGTLVLTGNSAIVNESNLCHTGGWPGDGLAEVCGIWQEEYETLEPGKHRAIRLEQPLGGRAAGEAFTADRYCGIVHARGAEVLATYAESFYAGTPCLTRHGFGEGQAWFLAAEFADGLLDALFTRILDEQRLGFPLGGEKPPGLAYQRRSNGEAHFHFLQNFTAEAIEVSLGEHRLRCLESSVEYSDKLALAPWQSGVYVETRKINHPSPAAR